MSYGLALFKMIVCRHIAEATLSSKRTTSYVSISAGRNDAEILEKQIGALN